MGWKSARIIIHRLSTIGDDAIGLSQNSKLKVKTIGLHQVDVFFPGWTQQKIFLTFHPVNQPFSMGSQAIQGALWGQRPEDWANIQERTGLDGYLYVLNRPEFDAAQNLLDVGCGSGLFSDMAHKKGMQVTGIDASAPLIEQARQRNPAISFEVGEMESLPYTEEVFDIACFFNSIQYAADVKNALREAGRILKVQGKLVIMIWGNPEECEAAAYLKAVGSLLPPPPAGAPGPFALSENGLLEALLQAAGFTIIYQADVAGRWDYETPAIALRGLISAGPVARAIAHSGLTAVAETVSAAIQPYVRPDGGVVFNNTYRIVVSEK